MPVYKFHYFDARGRGELMRLILAYGDIEYEDVRHTKEEWPKFKPKTPFGQMPVLEVDGKLIGQTGAISEFLAKKAGIYGRDDMEAALIRMICCHCDDMFKPIGAIFFEKDEARKAELLRKYRDEDLPAYMATLEKYLTDNKSSGHCVGDRMSLADIRLTADLAFPAMVGVNLDILDKYPKIKAVYETVNSNPKIAAWIAKRPKTDN